MKDWRIFGRSRPSLTRWLNISDASVDGSPWRLLKVGRADDMHADTYFITSSRNAGISTVGKLTSRAAAEVGGTVPNRFLAASAAEHYMTLLHCMLLPKYIYSQLSWSYFKFKAFNRQAHTVERNRCQASVSTIYKKTRATSLWVQFSNISVQTVYSVKSRTTNLQ